MSTFRPPHRLAGAAAASQRLHHAISTAGSARKPRPAQQQDQQHRGVAHDLRTPYAADTRKTRVQKKTRKSAGASHRRRRMHPLEEDFSDSLAMSSDAIQANTAGQLNDQHQTALSQVAAVMTQCEVYQAEQLAARQFFENMEIISPEYEHNVETVTQSLRNKQNHLDTLWKQWQELNDSICGLCDHAMTVQPEIPSDGAGDNDYEGEGSLIDEGYINAVLETFSEVKDKWVKKMEDSEKNLDDDLAKKRNLAAVAMM